MGGKGPQSRRGGVKPRPPLPQVQPARASPVTIGGAEGETRDRISDDPNPKKWVTLARVGAPLPAPGPQTVPEISFKNNRLRVCNPILEPCQPTAVFFYHTFIKLLLVCRTDRSKDGHWLVVTRI